MKASEVLDNLKRRFPNEPEYHQAVSEVLGTIEEAYNEHPEFEKSNLIERLCIPDRIFSFRVTWLDGCRPYGKRSCRSREGRGDAERIWLQFR